MNDQRTSLKQAVIADLIVSCSVNTNQNDARKAPSSRPAQRASSLTKHWDRRV